MQSGAGTVTSSLTKAERFSMIRRVMCQYVTDKPYHIKRILQDELGITMHNTTISKYIKMCQDDTYDLFGAMARGLYAEISNQELLDINEQLGLNLKMSRIATKETSLANLQHAYKGLLERRQVVIEDMVIYPRLAGKIKRLDDQEQAKEKEGEDAKDGNKATIPAPQTT